MRQVPVSKCIQQRSACTLHTHTILCMHNNVARDVLAGSNMLRTSAWYSALHHSKLIN